MCLTEQADGGVVQTSLSAEDTKKHAQAIAPLLKQVRVQMLVSTLMARISSILRKRELTVRYVAHHFSFSAPSLLVFSDHDDAERSSIPATQDSHQRANDLARYRIHSAYSSLNLDKDFSLIVVYKGRLG